MSVSYRGFTSTSRSATKAAKGASKKRDTSCEILLRRVLWRRGLRYRVDVQKVIGRPDIVFGSKRIAIFVDGDFWHGKDWQARKRRLARGSNSGYWVAKIEANRARDRRNDRQLQQDGWTVIRFWESEVRADPEAAGDRVEAAIQST